MTSAATPAAAAVSMSCLRVVASSFCCLSSSRLPKFAEPHLLSLPSSVASRALVVPSASMQYDKELAAATKAVSLAASLCQKSQKELLRSDVHSKLDRTPVTVADYGSQAIVSIVLERELSAEPLSLVAEEDSGDLRKDSGEDTLHRITKLVNETIENDGSYGASLLSPEDVCRAIDSGKSEGGSFGRHWVLDPIDGTKGFLRGDQYAVALALLDDGKVALGVLACPNLPLASIAGNVTQENVVGCLFYAKVGSGTFMQSLDGSSPVKVHVSDIGNSEDASLFESYEEAHSMQDLTSSIARKLGVKAPPVRIDSQVKYGALSRGDGAIYLRFPHKGYREKIWDHAAGCIVVTEAGGVVTNAAGQPLDFSKGRYLDLDTGIIATNQKLMPSLLKAVRESLEERSSSL
ncbi:SAL1 phosphatase-like [Rhodamnia argentea]|uniref:3'(2'),5'-bisphosphate nucleotidase n=1 Tax=Rhodamnia argentea TaxID=178133 RepID=A0A8B8Q9B8_9MYRT|nr:SAL1 phosphatase-like [Rhodamnia argentea]